MTNKIESPMTPQAKRLSGSHKRNFVLYVDDRADCPINTASYWDGGSKTSYSVLNMVTGATGYCPTGSYPTFQAEYVLKAQELLIETSIFLGKPGTPRFTCRSEDESLARKTLGITAVAAMAI